MQPLPQITLGQHSRAGPGGPNQDCHGAMLPAGHALAGKGIAMALADGISSSRVSQDASQTAVASFLSDYYATSEAWAVRRSAQCVISATNAWLHHQSQRSDARFDRDRGHVCTFSALILKGRMLHLLHVGDARLYRLHPQALEQLSNDHRVVLSPTESYLGRALGAAAQVEIDYHQWEATTGEVYLLASDGAYSHLDACAVHAALSSTPDDLNGAAAALTALAQHRGSLDDATVVLLRIDALPAADARHPQLDRAGLALPPPLAPGQKFEGFTLVRELQHSARSQVFLARDDSSGSQVVIKVPGTELREDGAALDRFVLEEWVARRVDNPHVLKAWPCERPRQHLFVAMDYVQGQTLAQWMVDHPRPSLDTVRTLLTQLARGLQALHGREMLHRDLRPENVMIDRDETAKLIDLASVWVAGLSENAPRQPADAPPGTLQYMAPELLLGQDGSAQSDLFSLAVLCYQMLSGQLPYGLACARVRSPRDMHTLRYVPLRHHRTDLPPWLDAVLKKALSTEPARRQEAVSEFVHDLHAPGAPFHSMRSPPLVERNPVRFWQATTLLLTLLLLGMVGVQILRS